MLLWLLALLLVPIGLAGERSPTRSRQLHNPLTAWRRAARGGCEDHLPPRRRALRHRREKRAT